MPGHHSRVCHTYTSVLTAHAMWEKGQLTQIAVTMCGIILDAVEPQTTTQFLFTNGSRRADRWPY